MSKAFLCDQCEEYFPAAPFEVYQAVDIDDDDEVGVDVLHFCSAKCLAEFAMDLAMTFEQEAS